MKKFLLSFFVIAVFAVYVFSMRNRASVASYQNSIDLNTAPAGEGSSNDVSPPAEKKYVSLNYKDGEYTGDVADAYYGNVQIRVFIKGSKIINVQFLDYPKDAEHSVEVNSQAMPILKSEAIQTQSAKVNVVSGATQTSQAFIESLSSALKQAKI